MCDRFELKIKRYWQDVFIIFNDRLPIPEFGYNKCQYQNILLSCLFVSDSLDWIHACGFSCRQVAEEYTNEGTYAKAEPY